MAFSSKKQKQSLADFLLANKPGCALLFGPDGLKPAETISGIIQYAKLKYTIHTVDTTTQDPADILHLIYSKEVFRQLKPKIIVLLFIEHIDKIMQDFIKTELFPQIKNKFIFFVIDDSIWTPWVGYLQKSNLPQFKLEVPNNKEKSLYLEKLNPFQLLYNEEKEKMTFETKLMQVSNKITNFSQLESYVSGVRAMNGVYDLHTENHCDKNFFKAICFLRSEAHAHTNDQWKLIEDTLDEHPTALKTLMINQPSFESSNHSYSLQCRAKWLEQFSELDTLGYKKPDLTPYYIATSSWNESYKNWNIKCSNQGKTPWYSVKTMTKINQGDQHNLYSTNEYLSNQFSFFQIFDIITQISNPKLIFQHYCKVIHDPCVIDLLVKQLANQFGILLLCKSSQVVIQIKEEKKEEKKVKKKREKKNEPNKKIKGPSKKKSKKL